ncbi:MAG: hypothetical protein K6E98_11505 [Lachnospiraceae bacterium]|nr:hypothetical protein [Lachnospiraceae bacterium]
MIELDNSKQYYSDKYSRYAFILGVISLTGMCCFPVMPVIGGLGIMFALISRGGADVFSKQAKNGLILSVIGTVLSVVLTVGIMGFSVYETINELKTNPGVVDEVEQQYESIYDQMGTEMPDELYEMFDELRQMSDDMNSAE